MVDVGSKPITRRVAQASGRVLMQPETLEAIKAHALEKGEVISCARIAGIMAAKRVAELIPLTHPLPLDHVEVLFEYIDSAINITAQVAVQARTGAEMEALTAVSVAALTIYDMAKAVDKDMVITEIKLMEKSGGKSGTYKRKP